MEAMNRRNALKVMLAIPAALGLVRLGSSESAMQATGGRSRHAPSGQPDRICLTWPGNPATTAAISWRTSTGISKGLIEFSEATRAPYDPRRAQRLDARSTQFSTPAGPCRMHRVRLSNLKPDTLYQYRVGDGPNWSEWMQFRTASAERKPFQFIYLGDTQNDIFSQVPRVARAAILDCPDALFMAHGGDLVDLAERDDQWSEFFMAYAHWTATIPQLAIPGNHDYSSSGGTRTLSSHWKHYFQYPAVDLPNLDQTVYTIDVMGVRFIGLNSMDGMQQQIPWMEKVLQNNPNPWTVVMFHHPLYSSGSGRDSTSRRRLWEPIFSKYNVDLILQGHDHTYARTRLIREGKGATNNGSVYLTSVAGPKMYKLSLSDLHVSGAARSQMYQVISVEGDRLRLDAKTVDGVLHDSFEIVKKSGGAKELVHLIPPQIYNP